MIICDKSTNEHYITITIDDIGTNKHETQMTDLSVIIGKCSFDSQRECIGCHLTNFGYFCLVWIIYAEGLIINIVIII